MKQSERTKRSVFITKKRLVSPPLNKPLRSPFCRVARVFFKYPVSSRIRATSSPEYWATTVPAATPTKPIPPICQPPRVNPRARTTLIRIFIPLTVKSVSIGLTLSCIPMNQPLRAIRLRVAGAAQIRTKKYLAASSRTSGVESTTRKAAWTKTHCIAMSTRAQASAIPRARANMRAHSRLSPRPKAWAARPPVPTLRKPKFQ